MINKLSRYLMQIYRNNLLFILLALILPFFIISVYNHPSADDYCLADTAKDLGILEAQLYWFTSWTGRYFSTFLITTNPLFFNSILGYQLVNILLLCLFSGSIFLILKTLFKDILSRIQIIIATLLILFIYLSGLPSIVEGIYWLAGAYTYFVSVILSLFSVHLILLLLKEPKKHRNLRTTLLYILAILLIGTNETILVVWNIVILFIVGLCFIKTRKLSKILVGLFIVTFISSLIVYFAPGNALRMSLIDTSNMPFFPATLNAVKSTLWVYKDWLLTTPILIVLSFSFFPFKAFIDKNKEFASKIYINPAINIIIMSGAITGAFFASFWSTGGYPPERSVNISYFLFIFGCFYLAFCITKFLIDRGIEINPLPIYANVILGILLLASVLSSRNILTPLRAILSGDAYNYSVSLFERYETIKLCNTNKDDMCIVKPRQIHPGAISYHDIQTDPEFWINRCVADYYELENIKTF